MLVADDEGEGSDEGRRHSDEFLTDPSQPGSAVVLVLPKVQQRPPPWKDLTRCIGCQLPFGLLRRHHHCRHCGGDFCAVCTPKEATIPKFGFLVSRVRLCVPCFDLVEQEKLGWQREAAAQNTVKSRQLAAPPPWAEEDTCFACSVVFTQTTRRHHCRNCGRSCCAVCSPKESAIPKFGFFVRKVRVCNRCHDSLRQRGEASLAVVHANV